MHTIGTHAGTRLHTFNTFIIHEYRHDLMLPISKRTLARMHCMCDAIMCYLVKDRHVIFVVLW